MSTKLYTDDEIKQAMIVGVGLGGEGAVPAGTNQRIDAAMEVFRGGHGHAIPNYETFRNLAERREWGALAEAHMAAGLMTSGAESVRHAELGRLAATLMLAGEVGHAGGAVDSLDTAIRARG